MLLPDAWLPWLAIAGTGIVHGLHPASGWLFALAQASPPRGVHGVRAALLPIAAGQALSVAGVVALVMQGVPVVPARLQALAGVGLIAYAAWRLWRPAARPITAWPWRSRAGLVGWSCVMGGAHGSGLMLVPAWLPLCLAGGPARAITVTGSLALMLVAVTLHLLAMLATTFVIATAVRNGWRRWAPPRGTRVAGNTAWMLALLLSGGALVLLR